MYSALAGYTIVVAVKVKSIRSDYADGTTDVVRSVAGAAGAVVIAQPGPDATTTSNIDTALVRGVASCLRLGANSRHGGRNGSRR
jgi:hypothetical protein